jgi:mannose-6-phosphate isomerase-like protein (cupin superfamily)
MPKAVPKSADFPDWSEVSTYGVNTLVPGQRVEPHFHDANEFWIIISGRGTAMSEGIEYELGPGDMLLTKAGDEHSMIVHEDMVATYFYGVMLPGGRMGYLFKGTDLPYDEYIKTMNDER